jgi:oligogalacturonide transport system substrate-binding protein
MRKFAFLTACLLFVLCTGCADETVIKTNQEQTEISLSWWGNDGRNEYTIEAVEKFQELHPEIKVNCSYSEWSGYEARSRVQMVADTEADVMQVNFSWLSQYSEDGTGYYDLSKLTDTLNLDTFTEDTLQYGYKNKILNAVPIAMNTQTVYINQTVYEKYGLSVPETWDDYFKSAKVMSKDGIYPLSGASRSIWIAIIGYTEQVVNKKFLTDEGKLNFTAEELQVPIEFYCRLVNEKVIPQVEYFDRLKINDGGYAGFVAWVSDAANYSNTAIENGYNVIVGDYPHISGKESGSGWYAKPATMYAVSKNTEHPKESAMLLDFLLNSPEMAVLQGIEKGIPISTSARETLIENDMLSGIQYEAFQRMEAHNNLGILNPFLENADAVDFYVEACNEVLYSKATLEEASQTFYEKLLTLREE